MTREAALAAVAVLLGWAGGDPSLPGLVETPRRVVDALHEMTAGGAVDVTKILATSFDEEEYSSPVTLRGVAFSSLCEHHLLPFWGRALVSYVPAGKRVVGISKLARLVDAFAQRLQIQERLTVQIAGALVDHLKPAGVGVVLVAEHSCMGCRGVGKPGAELITSRMLGSLQHREHELLSLVC